jgi:hypothetical protein
MYSCEGFFSGQLPYFLPFLLDAELIQAQTATNPFVCYYDQFGT